MKRGTTPIFNERAWGIQIISEINQIVSSGTVRYSIKRAGGEFGTAQTGASTLFPDVLLFGDVAESLIIQGWELKMPETDIADVKLISNAREKARRMQTGSFLVWNGRTAVLYVEKMPNEWDELARWNDAEIKTRDDLRRKPEVWKATLRSILMKIDEWSIKGVAAGRTKTVEQLDFLTNSALITVRDSIEGALRKEYARSRVFRTSIDSWWLSVRDEHPEVDEGDANGALSVRAIEVSYHWVFRTLFVHYMKTFEHEAHGIDSISETSAPKDFDDFCEKLSMRHDFALLLRPRHDLPEIPAPAWCAIVSFNRILSSVCISSLSQPELHAIVQQLQSRERMKALGQFPTPKRLADLLARLVVDDAENDTMLDPCCGTGTLARAIMDERHRLGVSESVSYRTTWASDRFRAPLQFATLALSSGNNMDEVIRVFQRDALLLKVGDKIEFCDPKTGSTVKEALPLFSTIVVNPPFIRFENWKKAYSDEDDTLDKVSQLPIDRRSDFLVPVVLHLAEMLKPDGILGLVLPNSWLGADWARAFRREVVKRYKILEVVGSLRGRWFPDAKIVTNLVVLRKRSSTKNAANDSMGDKPVSFALAKKGIADWSDGYIGRIATEIAASAGDIDDGDLMLRRQSIEDLALVDELGLSWTAGFASLGWLRDIRSKLVFVRELFDVARGERRGWDKMFFPSAEDAASIEDRFLAPVVKSASSVATMLAAPDGVAFCCGEAKDELTRRNCVGALKWIDRFERGLNESGRPLPEVLARPNQRWYEMSASTRADIAVSINPGERLFFMRMRAPTFVNQRLIRFSRKRSSVDLELCHALLCSFVGCFFLEAFGFGRGEGVLDLNATKLRTYLPMLNPELLSQGEKKLVKAAFRPLISRQVINFSDECTRSDRINFEHAVLRAFGCESQYGKVLAAVKTLHELRLAPVRT